MEIRQAISMYLTAKAYNEPEFKTKFENPAKNLDKYQVVQSRGLQNKSTRYHKRIVKLVNENMGEIKRRNTKKRIAV